MRKLSAWASEVLYGSLSTRMRARDDDDGAQHTRRLTQNDKNLYLSQVESSQLQTNALGLCTHRYLESLLGQPVQSDTPASASSLSTKGARALLGCLLVQREEALTRGVLVQAAQGSLSTETECHNLPVDILLVPQP